MTNEAAMLLRRAADCVEGRALTEKQLTPIKLVALHVIDLCGSGVDDRCLQTKLLLSVLDAEK